MHAVKVENNPNNPKSRCGIEREVILVSVLETGLPGVEANIHFYSNFKMAAERLTSQPSFWYRWIGVVNTHILVYGNFC